MDQRYSIVLVVEDDFDAGDLIAETLREAGYPVVHATDGADALAVLETVLRPRVILLDLSLPGVDGYELTRRVRSDPRLRDIPLVICTGEPAHRLGRVAADGYLPKPLDLEAVVATTARWYRRGRSSISDHN